MSTEYLLHETPVGYALFKVLHPVDAIANRTREVQESMNDLARFGKMIEKVSFVSFQYGIR